MGRKIPGRKHKGIKDPVKQRAKRDATLQNKINAPPAILDFQETPKSVEHILKLNHAVKDNTVRTKKKKRKRNRKQGLINTENMMKNDTKLPGMTKAEKPVPAFVQQPGETDGYFLHRIEQACHQVIQESQFEEKYGVNVTVDPDTGDVSVTKKTKDELDDLEKPKSKKRKKEGTEVKLSKKERRKQKLEAVKKLKLENSRDDFERFQDKVKFGETVHAPPTIKSLPRKVVLKETTFRPGRKDLLLKPMLQTNAQSVSTYSGKVKKRSMPLFAQQQLELQRKQAVEAYRMLKAQK